MKRIEEYSPCELATLATVVGVIIATKLNVNQQNVVGILFIVLLTYDKFIVVRKYNISHMKINNKSTLVEN